MGSSGDGGRRSGLSGMQHRDITCGRHLPRMRGSRAKARGGRRGRRTPAMTRIARERIADLLGLAEREGGRGGTPLARRYVILARRIGMRYNVRFLPEHRDRYCRGCSAYWIEGASVRTRFRSGKKVRTCLMCGRISRRRLSQAIAPAVAPDESTRRSVGQAEAALVDEFGGVGEEENDDGDEQV